MPRNAPEAAEIATCRRKARGSHRLAPATAERETQVQASEFGRHFPPFHFANNSIYYLIQFICLNGEKKSLGPLPRRRKASVFAADCLDTRRCFMVKIRSFCSAVLDLIYFYFDLTLLKKKTFPNCVYEDSLRPEPRCCTQPSGSCFGCTSGQTAEEFIQNELIKLKLF